MKKFFMVCTILLMSTICYADGFTEMMFDDATFPVEKVVIKRNKDESSYNTRTRELAAERQYALELRKLVEELSIKLASYEVATKDIKPIVTEVKHADIEVIVLVGIITFLVGIAL